MRLAVRLYDFDPVGFAAQILALPPGAPHGEQYRKYLGAAAAGACQEVMSILSLPSDHRWHICGGAHGYPEDSGPHFHIMCFSGWFDLLPAQDLYEIWGSPEQFKDRTWLILIEAQQRIRTVQKAMYTSWLLDGAFEGPKLFMPAWLVPREVP